MRILRSTELHCRLLILHHSIEYSTSTDLRWAEGLTRGSTGRPDLSIGPPNPLVDSFFLHSPSPSFATPPHTDSLEGRGTPAHRKVGCRPQGHYCSRGRAADAGRTHTQRGANRMSVQARRRQAAEPSQERGRYACTPHSGQQTMRAPPLTLGERWTPQRRTHSEGRA